MNDRRNSSERHRAAADRMDAAVKQLRVALAHEGDLEWAGAIRDLIGDAEFICKRLRAYVQYAEGG